jgi:urease accessory protein
MLRATSIRRDPGKKSSSATTVLGAAVLQHDERHLRRKTIALTNGVKILVDLKEPVVVGAGDELVTDDGSVVEIVAAEEPLYCVVARDHLHLTELAWHIGNRHLPAAILADKIFILRDHVIKSMLEGLGATVSVITAPFNPVRGAYGASDPMHGHDHQQ